MKIRGCLTTKDTEKTQSSRRKTINDSSSLQLYFKDYIKQDNTNSKFIPQDSLVCFAPSL